MHSFFTQPAQGGVARISQEDARHIQKALRMQPGDHLVVVYENARHLAQLVEDGQGLGARVLERLPDNEPLTRVTLYQGLPKGDKMDLIVQKCTELGVHRIVPCLFSRCVARWEGGEKKLARWQRIAREAAVQCGRGHIPQVEDALPFEKLPDALRGHALALMPWEDARQGGMAAHMGTATNIALVIGPEGGIAPEEAAALPARPITLGPRILRTETAGMAALTMLLTLRGDMG